ncbi:MAG: hypothetical protein DRO14_02430 [Thermoprotei archaeon]|nr:MAG: hypothetical protein DRO14_02430 [Thermoprotei archaeon]
MALIFVDPSVRKYGILLALGFCRNVEVEVRRPDIQLLVRKVSQEVASRFTLDALRVHPVVKAYRDIMWKLGINPTRTLPLNESLVRRVLRRGFLTSVNSVIDSCNLACIKTLVPLSVFDAELINYPLTLRRAVAGEEFRYLNSKIRRLIGREVVLADSAGKVLHLYPCRDSVVAQVTDRTREVLIVGYGAPEAPSALVIKAVELAQKFIRRFHPEVRCGRVGAVL